MTCSLLRSVLCPTRLVAVPMQSKRHGGSLNAHNHSVFDSRFHSQLTDTLSRWSTPGYPHCVQATAAANALFPALRYGSQQQQRLQRPGEIKAKRNDLEPSSSQRRNTEKRARPQEELRQVVCQQKKRQDQNEKKYSSPTASQKGVQGHVKVQRIVDRPTRCTRH